MRDGDKIFVSPDKYIQGAGLLERSAKYIQPFGRKIVLIADKIIWGIAGDEFSNYLEKQSFQVTKVVFQGESSADEVERITQIAKDKDAEVVIGLGGGKTIDTSKGVADKAQAKLVIIPTAASADAPTAGLSVIYDDDGTFSHYAFYTHHSNLVLMDTKIVANAPVRTLVSGIADAMATNIEAKVTAQSYGVTYNGRGGVPTLAGRAIAAACEDTLWKHAYEAVEASKQNLVTPALENVVEANTLLSGLGFENGGLAAAHAVQDGFTAVKGDIHKLTHGEKVAFGTMVELVLEGASHEKLNKYIKFYLTLGLPITLEDTNLDELTAEELYKIGKKATDPSETMSNMPFKVTPEMVINAMKSASYLAHSYADSHEIKPIFVNKALKS
ncbi:glycerol dehydrogenase [Liquorilactobacillus nagelii]|uniref:glycerol dehydrogenase n=1 Tax=Liquorilactobacillus nagelii TaxID=82688 RepID=UPI0006EE6242|nr:glycerol dehydrogenase [Liquorilactobacillus nagelii]KRL40403.1 iron-containing alcohol dehydrogenase [Liquorilactobacillus nagelii DSM 13675]QYH54704.1 glycerol dehydrogenase [Liquorilactobacillus nagelii DSM 13675]